MIKKVAIFVLLAVILASCSLNSRIQKADKKFALGEYYVAADMYKNIYPRVPNKQKKLKGQVAYKLGNSMRLIENNVKAEAAYKNAIKFGNKDSMVYYFYAEALRSNGKYKEAIGMYEKQAELTGTSPLLTEGVESCKKSIEIGKSGSRYVVTKEGKFNSKQSDFCPAFASADNDVLYFNSTRVARNAKKKSKTSRVTGQRNNQIYSTKTNVKGVWDTPEVLEAEGINTEFDQGTVSFSADFQTMFYTLSRQAKGETLGAQIYSSERTGAAWSEPKLVKLLNDSSITVAHPAMDRNGEWLYFVSDMPGSLGGKDIWRSKLGEEGWTAPENLGPSINTAGEEMFPSFGPDGTLYFSSDGHTGFGGLDIYSATFKGDSIGWEVVNMQQPINSRFDDFGITVASTGGWGYFSSNRGDRKNYDHIYKFELPILTFMVEGSVKNSAGDALGDATIKIIGSNGTIANIKTRKNGTYTYEVSPNTKYLMLGTSRGFLNQKQELEVPDLDKNKNFTMDFVLTSISKPVKMDNIFYEFGKATLTPDSYKGLDALVKLLKDNPNITIEIGAHTDYVGSDAANKKLSEDRAWSVTSYLLEKGIDKDRITSVGYGETEPVVPDKALVRQNRFLKVGQPLTEEFIKTLTQDQQDKANAINRRTEFKVTKTTYKMY